MWTREFKKKNYPHKYVTRFSRNERGFFFFLAPYKFLGQVDFYVDEWISEVIRGTLIL